MNFVDVKYVNLLSNRLDRFTVKSTMPYRVNCRCPICGDSQKNKSKARGWLLEKDNSAIYYCHNCNASMGLRKFLQQVDPTLYNDYIVDTKLESVSKTEVATKPLDTITQKVPEFRKVNSPLLKIRKVSQLTPTHGAKLYVEKRLIPTSSHHRLYYAPKFNAWVNSIVPDKLTGEKDGPRLILPFIKDGRMFGFQGRAFDKTSLRYITIMLDESMPKIFGLDTVNLKQKHYIVEGPIDSLFIPNSIAMAGADGNSKGLDYPENAVYIFDNEPRNKEIVARMSKIVERGQKVCIWPTHVRENDINDMILSGLSSADIKLIIDNNTYSGLDGKLQLSEWRKV